MSNRLQKQASEKADHIATSQNFVSGVVVISLLMELSVGNENHSFTLHAYVADFGKSGHKFISDKGLTVHIKHVAITLIH